MQDSENQGNRKFASLPLIPYQWLNLFSWVFTGLIVIFLLCKWGLKWGPLSNVWAGVADDISMLTTCAFCLVFIAGHIERLIWRRDARKEKRTIAKSVGTLKEILDARNFQEEEIEKILEEYQDSMK